MIDKTVSDEDRQAFVNAMRGVAHSVCVVTTSDASGRHGATVSAFCSVSADPPTALVCLNSETRIAEQVLENGRFNINILPESAQFIAERFAGQHDNEVDDRFDGIELRESELPVINGATVFHCQVEQSVAAGTHHVIIGTVFESQREDVKPLTYLEGTYQKVVEKN